MNKYMQSDFKYIVVYYQNNESRIVYYEDLTSAVAGYKDCLVKGMERPFLAKIKPVQITVSVADDE